MKLALLFVCLAAISWYSWLIFRNPRRVPPPSEQALSGEDSDRPAYTDEAVGHPRSHTLQVSKFQREGRGDVSEH
jgi:hypothetical protein